MSAHEKVPKIKIPKPGPGGGLIGPNNKMQGLLKQGQQQGKQIQAMRQPGGALNNMQNKK